MEDPPISADSQTDVDSPSPRRAPVQLRSQQTVQRVLDAAGALLQQVSLEEITTTRIAAEAGLSIGALYRFFPDKQTIIDAIAVRHVENFKAEVEPKLLKLIVRDVAGFKGVDPARLLDAVIDAYIVYLDAHPD